jgi:hypothetical protein
VAAAGEADLYFLGDAAPHGFAEKAVTVCNSRLVIRGQAMTRWLWLVIVLSTATISGRSLATEKCSVAAYAPIHAAHALYRHNWGDQTKFSRQSAHGRKQFGAGMNASHVQVYGWVEVGGNVSTNPVKPGGNAPVGYDYTPNTVQLDQAVVYIERLPDTVQNDHFDLLPSISMYSQYFTDFPPGTAARHTLRALWRRHCLEACASEMRPSPRRKHRQISRLRPDDVLLTLAGNDLDDQHYGGWFTAKLATK